MTPVTSTMETISLKSLHKVGFQVGVLGAVLGAEISFLFSMGVPCQLLAYTAWLSTESQKIIKRDKH